MILRNDEIISLNKKYFSNSIKIENITEKGEFFYEGVITENTFPIEVIETINEFWHLVNSFCFALLDDVEEIIYKDYQFILKNSNVMVFDIELKEGNRITFFSKYPTAKGFLDFYPTEIVE